MTRKKTPATAAPSPTRHEKNIQYRGPFQFRVSIRRRGHPEIQKTFETLAEAVDFRDTIQAKVKLGSLVDLRQADAMTFGELAQAYLDAVTPQKKGNKSEIYRLRRVIGYTKKADGKIVIGISDPDGRVVPPQTIAHYKLSICTSDVVFEWIDERLSEGWSPANIDRYRHILSAIFNWGRGVKRLPIANPFDGIPTLASMRDNERNRRISQEEEAALVEALESLTYQEDAQGHPVLDEDGRPFLRRRPPTPTTRRRSAFFRLALETACRRGELLRLKWLDKDGSEVNLDEGYMFLKGSKNGDDRMIGLTDRAIRILGEVQAQGILHEDHSVFGFSEEGWKAAWRRAVIAARLKYEQDCETKGVPPDPQFLADLHFHDSRHEGATQLAKILDKYDLMKQGGWRDVRSMMRYYNPSGSDMRNKLAGFERQPERQKPRKVVPFAQK